MPALSLDSPSRPFPTPFIHEVLRISDLLRYPLIVSAGSLFYCDFKREFFDLVWYIHIS